MIDELQIKWQDEDRKVLLLESDDWTWDDLNDSITMIHMMLDDVDYPVTVMLHIDSLASEIIDRMPSMDALRALDHPYLGRLVLVGTNGLTEDMMSILTHVHQKVAGKLLVAKSFEQAYAALI